MAELTPAKLSPRDKLKTGLALSKVPPYEMLQFAFDARARGCSLQTCAGKAGISKVILSLMLELGEEGHEVWEPVWLTWERKSRHDEIDEAEFEEAVNGSGKSRENVRLRDQAETYDNIYRPEVSAGENRTSFPGGVEIIYNKFTAAEPVKALPVVDAEVVEDKDENV